MPVTQEEFTGMGGSVTISGTGEVLSVDKWSVTHNCDWKDSTDFQSAGKVQQVPGNQSLDISFELNLNKQQLLTIQGGVLCAGEYVEDLLLEDGEAIIFDCPVVSILNVKYDVPQADMVRLTITAKTHGDFSVNADTPEGAPVADFVGVPLTGAAPYEVAFTDLSTNHPTSWLWDFGDGTPGSENRNPKHIYASAIGSPFTVALTAANILGADDEIKVGYITVT